MKTQILKTMLLFYAVVVGFTASSADLTEKCYELKRTDMDLCISDSYAQDAPPHAVQMELRSRIDGRGILGGFPYLLVANSADHSRNLNEYMTASPQIYWEDLPPVGGLLSRQFSPITFNGYISDKTLNEVGVVKLGNKIYEYVYVKGEFDHRK